MSSVCICSRSDVGICGYMGREGQVNSCVFFLRFVSLKNVSDGCDGEQSELGTGGKHLSRTAGQIFSHSSRIELTVDYTGSVSLKKS